MYYIRLVLLAVTFSLGLFLAPSPVVRAANPIWVIEVESHSEDMVGQRLVYAVKEAIRRSASMRLTESDEPRMKIIINTLGYEGNNSLTTVYSVAWVWATKANAFETYLYGNVGYSGRDAVQSSAETILARTDQLLSTIQKSLTQ